MMKEDYVLLEQLESDGDESATTQLPRLNTGSVPIFRSKFPGLFQDSESFFF